MSETPGAAAPGWYPDSSTPGQLRYWDGTAWTAQTQPAPGPAGGYGQAAPGYGAAPGGFGQPAAAGGYGVVNAGPAIGFQDAVRRGFERYVKFDGRATRPEYWWWVLFAFVVSLVAEIIDKAIGTPILQILVFLALLLPGLAVAIRRLHDTNRSGWWILIGVVPIAGFIILIVFLCIESTVGPNDYGPPST